MKPTKFNFQIDVENIEITCRCRHVKFEMHTIFCKKPKGCNLGIFVDVSCHYTTYIYSASRCFYFVINFAPRLDVVISILY